MHGEGFRKLGFPVCALCCKTRRMSDSNVVIRKKDKMHGEGFRKLGFPVCALCCKTRRMSDSNVVIRKKRGRPRTGQDPVLSFRWGLDFKEAIDRWRAGEPHKPSRSEAIRWLIGQCLHVELKQRPK